MLKRREINNSVEEKILTGLIVSSHFCREAQNLIHKDIFQNPYAKIISGWAIDYYKKYGESIQKHIQDVFEIEKDTTLKEEDKNIISVFLSRLSTKYEEEVDFNVSYLLDKTVWYSKKQSLKNTSERIQHLLELDKIDEAEKEIAKYKKISKEVSGIFDPLCKEEIDKYFSEVNDKSNIVLRLPGAVGDLMGDLERHWLVGILAPTKRGKTFWQQEFAVTAVMERRRVFFVSLEMDKTRVKKRLYKRLTGFADRTDDYVYPCFDCVRNQKGDCRKKERTNQVKLLTSEGVKPQYDRSSPYNPCVSCRGKKDFILGTWFTTLRKEGMKRNSTIKILQGIKQAFGDRLRIKSYPKFSANIHDIMADLQQLEENENFIPDVIIIDYADILAPEDTRVTGRERIDETWKTMGRMADEYHALVISASQSNRQSFKKKYVEEVDASEDIRKIANSDLFIALNQTPQEKRESVMRINVIADRDGEFDSFQSALVLQQLSIGQVCLDSEIIIKTDDTDEDNSN